MHVWCARNGQAESAYRQTSRLQLYDTGDTACFLRLASKAGAKTNEYKQGSVETINTVSASQSRPSTSRLQVAPSTPPPPASQAPPKFPHVAARAAGQASPADGGRRVSGGFSGEPLLRGERLLSFAPGCGSVRTGGPAAGVRAEMHHGCRRGGGGVRVLPGPLRGCDDEGGGFGVELGGFCGAGAR